MKKRLYSLTYLLATGLLLCMGCNKERLLPDATQEGANTLGCLVDGKAWVPKGGGGYSGIKPVEGGYQGITYDTIRKCIWVRATHKDGSGVHLWVRNVVRPGEYLLNFNTGTSPSVILPKNYGYYYSSKGSYLTNSEYTGKVIITKIDTLVNKVAGTFEFTAYDSQTKQTVRLTKGRFDVDRLKQ